MAFKWMLPKKMAEITVALFVILCCTGCLGMRQLLYKK
ncbi:hypothetical protein SALWKB12_1685 [Snodgrassella communis]|nr:hypothetical protein SALWKB12_1685 [Snodgrassella communis]